MSARCLAILGTASDAGKSTLVVGLARALVRRGHRVAPFKAQNMARNAYVCADGGEIGVAQAVQARAAGIEPSVDHNPILLKPEPGLVSQVIVHGRSRGRHRFGEYHARGDEMRDAIMVSLARVRAAADVVLLEGAGSPAEINLRDHDLANHFATRAADASIVLVTDIDRGGAFASLVGTLALLPDDLRARVAGFVINKLYGDASLLASGIEELEQRTGVRVLGVVPHLGELGLPDEDSVAVARFRRRPRAGLDEIEVSVVDTPSLANFEDVLAFAEEPCVRLRLTSEPREILETDLVVLAGSKSTAQDLAFLRDRGLDRALVDRARANRPILGICGGTQMLGRAIHDPDLVESPAPLVRGLGLLPLETHFLQDKCTVRLSGSLALEPDGTGESARVEGFHLHHGRIEVDAGTAPVVRFDDGTTDGARVGAVLGTMVHRVADGATARRRLLGLCAKSLAHGAVRATIPDPFERLADAIEASIDLSAIERILRGANA